MLTTLNDRVHEDRRFIQVLVGPRQVGKTTLLDQLEGQLPRDQFFVHRVSADAIGAAGSSWLDQAWTTARVGLRLSGLPCGLLIVDEAQKVTDWAEVVKANWDDDTRARVPLQVIISGSSRLMLQQGLGESLLGRFEILHMNHWSYPEMRDAFGFTPTQFAWFGGYPGAAPLIGDETRFKNYILDSVIEASLNRDIFLLSRIDKPALLRQLFELGLLYSGQIVSLNKMLGQMADAGNTTTLSRYLKLLDEAGLLGGLTKYSPRELAGRTSSPKYQTYNTALYSAMRAETLDDAQADTTLWGRVVENAVGAQLINQVTGDKLARLQYWRDGDNEVDFLLQWHGKTVGIEVKSGHGPARGIARFNGQYPGIPTLTVSDYGLDWQTFLQASLDDVIAAM